MQSQITRILILGEEELNQPRFQVNIRYAV
jgi:hypothetical protein